MLLGEVKNLLVLAKNGKYIGEDMPDFEMRADVIEKIDLRTSSKKHSNILFGMMPSSPIHLGIDKLMVELKATQYQTGAQITIFLADLHARFKTGKSYSEVNSRVDYYKSFVTKTLGREINIVLGSDIQFNPAYVEKLYEVASSFEISKIRNAAPQSMKLTGESDNLSLIYLVMQCLDPIHLGVDAVFAEYSQKKIYDLSKSFLPFVKSLPQVIYTSSSHDITGKFIQQSVSGTRICIHDTPLEITKKIRKMFAPPGGQSIPNDRVDALLECYKWSVFPFMADPIKILSSKTKQLLAFNDFDSFKDAYDNQGLHPLDCKLVLVDILTKRCAYLDAQIPNSDKIWLYKSPKAA